MIHSQLSGSASADNATVIQTDEISDGNTFEFGSTEGAMDLFVKLHVNDNWRGPVSFADRGAADLTPVLVTAAGGYYAFRGSPYAVKLQQSGGTDVNGAFLRISTL